MRIKIKLSSGANNIPINNQSIVNSYIHKCLGENNTYHDRASNYCVSNIRGCKLNDDKTTLTLRSPYIVVSTNDNIFLSMLLAGITNHNQFYDNIVVTGIEFIQETLYDGYNLFKTLTPILLKEKNTDGSKRTITVNDEDFVPKLKDSIIRKIKSIDPSIDVSGFDLKLADNTIKKTKMITVKNVTSVGSLCDIIVFSNKKLAEFIYNFGIGQSTGSGFGCIYEYKNYKLYY